MKTWPWWLFLPGPWSRAGPGSIGITGDNCFGLVHSAMQSTASVHTLHMSKPVITRAGLSSEPKSRLRLILICEVWVLGRACF